MFLNEITFEPIAEFKKLNATKTFGKNNSQSITFKVDNLLGDKRESRYNYFGNTEYLFSQLDPGRTFSLGYSFRF